LIRTEQRPFCWRLGRFSVTNLSLVVSDITLGCPGGWEKIGDYCYQQNDNGSVVSTWAEANAKCIARGAQLVKLISAEQTNAIKQSTRNGWIGLNSIANPGDPRIYSYPDQTPVLYTPWDTQISRNAFNNTNCVATVASALAKVQIAAYDCEERRSFTCMLPLIQLELIPSDCVKPPHDNGCREWGNAWRDSCFYMGNEPNAPAGSRKFVNFEEARSFCRLHYNADLASIDTLDQQDFLTSIIGVWAADYWVGLKGREEPWAAFKTWVTGQSVSITNWAHGQPHPDRVAAGCVALHGGQSEANLPGDWYVDDCGEKKFALCEGPRQGYTRPTVGPTTFPSGCPRGWNSSAQSLNCYIVCHNSKFYSKYLELEKINSLS
jgi:Lectin C-type domain